MSDHDHVSAHVHGDLTAELQASRVRIVEAADQARRRLERDLHDGAQQRFVSASMLLGLIRREAKDHDPRLMDLLGRLAHELDATSMSRVRLGLERPSAPSCRTIRTIPAQT